MYENPTSHMTGAKSSRTIHETVSTSLNKIASGDLKDIYAMMIIGLKLDDHVESARIFGLSKIKLFKPHPYTFYVDQAVQAMGCMQINIECWRTTTTISYAIKPALATHLINKFFHCKLLHSPSERTRSQVKPTVALQPTAKGVAVLQDFCIKVGMHRDRFPSIVYSSYNTMDLFKFERDPVTDKVIYSDYFLYLVFIKLCGTRPNVWSPSSNPDAIKTHEHSKGGTISDFQALDTSIFAPKDSENFAPKDCGNLGVNYFDEPSSVELSRTNKSRVSPYHHRYFTNPESDAHTQYYVSSCGVRLFGNRIFSMDGDDVMIKYCASGKAIYQWLFECTDLMSGTNCVEMANLMMKIKLFNPVLLKPSRSTPDQFCSDRDCFYVLSGLGRKIAHWDENDDNDENANDFENDIESTGANSVSNDSSESTSFSLKDVLDDPGMTYLFRKHLENDLCSENLNSYLQLRLFERKVRTWGRLVKVEAHESNADRLRKINHQTSKLASLCLALAYHIYFTYLSSESPFLLNIDYQIREKITKIMVAPQKEPMSNSGQLQPKPQPADTGETVAQKGSHPEISSKETPDTETLAQLASLFKTVSSQVYRLMQIDAFPKFLASDLFKQATTSVEVRKK